MLGNTEDNVKILKNLFENNDFFKQQPSQHINNLITNNNHIKIINSVRGLTNIKQRSFINTLISSYNDVNYMEIGSYYGATLVSALLKNESVLNKIIINDHWSWGDADFDGFKSEVFDALKEFYNDRPNNFYFSNKYNTNKYNMSKLEGTMFDLTIVKGETFDSTQDILSTWGNDKVDIYFYDGGHTWENQRAALVEFRECFADEFIFIVDDFDTIEVRQGTAEGIRLLGVKSGYDVLYSVETQDWNENREDSNGWGGGLFVSYLKKR
tara:strand:+ start:16548 stop:17351 length:804 start_codon:yes stop_codon:yes gene_type:complete